MNKGLVPRATQKEELQREVAGKTFNLARMDSAHLGKMTKEGQPKKLSLKKVRIRSLEGREIEGQPSKDTSEWKVSKKILGKQHQKKKPMRNKEMTSHQSG